MNEVTCAACGHVFDATITPLCPKCLSDAWRKAPGFIKPKHDPSLLPKSELSFRSVVTPEFVSDQEKFTG